MKFSDRTYLPDTQDMTHIVEQARQIVTFVTGRGYWVVTGIYRGGEIVTFEHVKGAGEPKGTLFAAKKR